MISTWIDSRDFCGECCKGLFGAPKIETWLSGCKTFPVVRCQSLWGWLRNNRRRVVSLARGSIPLHAHGVDRWVDALAAPLRRVDAPEAAGEVARAVRVVSHGGQHGARRARALRCACPAHADHVTGHEHPRQPVAPHSLGGKKVSQLDPCFRIFRLSHTASHFVCLRRWKA